MVKTKDYSQNNVGELIREVHLFCCFLNLLALSGSCTCNLHLITIQKAQFKVYITKLLEKKGKCSCSLGLFECYNKLAATVHHG